MAEGCVFCEIVGGSAPASRVYEDDRSLCFMTLRPTRTGECVVIPKEHIDHFIDIPDHLTEHLARVVRVVGRAVYEEYSPLRVGLIVHGFGVPHAHFIVVPQHDEDDITSGRFAEVDDGQIVFRPGRIAELPRLELDRHAERLRAQVASRSGTAPHG